jgi:hypothetical protein
MLITHTARAAADRARTLAVVLTNRKPADNADADVLRTVATHMVDVAHAFETDEPVVFDGIPVTNVIPADAFLGLLDAEAAAEGSPRHAYLRDLIRYVTVPVGGEPPKLPYLTPSDDGMAFEEIGLSARIAMAASSLDTASTTTTRYAILADLVDLHHRFALLAAAVAAVKAGTRDDH